MTRVGLPRALSLNGFRLTCPGHRDTRFNPPGNITERKRLEEKIGQRVFCTWSAAYAFSEVPVSEGTIVDLPCTHHRGLHLFDLREAIAAQANSEGLDAVFARGGELQILGLEGEAQIDGIRVQPRLRVRVTDEGFMLPDSLLVARHDHRWLVAGSLADPALRLRAPTEMAERLAGEGPRRGRVVATADGCVSLHVGGRTVKVRQEDYTLRASSRYVNQHHKADTLAQLQVASGSLADSRRRNRYAVRDRFSALIDDLSELGWKIDMPIGRAARIEPRWPDIRVREES